MSWYDEAMEKEIDSYLGEYKKGLLGKKYSQKLIAYPSHFEGVGVLVDNGEINSETTSFHVGYAEIKDVYEMENGDTGIVIEYFVDSIVKKNATIHIAVLGITDRKKWIELLKKLRDDALEKSRKAELLNQEKEEQERKLLEEREKEASQFYLDCYNFHIHDETPCYELYQDTNRIAVIYIGEDRSLNFLKIDGYSKEESNGMIPFDKIHYYEKAGDIHYVAEIQGAYSSYGGSVTGGKFLKLAAVGGGLLFGMMGMTAGALLTYEPIKAERPFSNF